MSAPARELEGFPWVVVDPLTEAVRCRRCKKWQYVSGREVEGWIAALTTFLRVHRDCREADGAGRGSLFNGGDPQEPPE